MPPEATGTGSAAAGQFENTQWTIVLSAAHGDDTRARDALAELCRVYHYPLYAFVRRQGQSREDAQDLTQAFFERLIARQSLATVDRARGRFRSFLIASLRNFVANEWERARAQKRGGGCTLLPLDATSAETRYGFEAADKASPDKLFDRAWALTLLNEVFERLQTEQRAAGKEAQFERLRASLMADPDAPAYAELAAELGMTSEAVRMAVCRLRRRYRELLRQEIARTLSPPAKVDDELRHLLDALET